MEIKSNQISNIDGFEVDFVKFEDLCVVELFDYFVAVEYFAEFEEKFTVDFDIVFFW